MYYFLCLQFYFHIAQAGRYLIFITKYLKHLTAIDNNNNFITKLQWSVEIGM